MTHADTTITDAPLQEGSLPHYIAIEGPFGSGKRELAIKLAETLGYDALTENVEHNPFIDAFFKNNPAHALACHLYFLLDRKQILINQQKTEQHLKIADFIVHKDHFLAKTLLPEDEFEIYQQIFDYQAVELEEPDLVIYLQMPTLTIQRRLQEQPYANLETMHPSFLAQVNDAYRDFFHYYDDTPLLIVNAEGADFIHDTSVFNTLLEQLAGVQSGRHYFNPEFIPETPP